MKKPVHKSRTNQTVALLVATVAGERIARKLGMEPDSVTEALLAAGEVLLGALAVYFRQNATAPIDRQDVVSTKPSPNSTRAKASAKRTSELDE